MMRMRSNRLEVELDTWIYFGKYAKELGLSQVCEGGVFKNKAHGLLNCRTYAKIKDIHVVCLDTLASFFYLIESKGSLEHV